MCVCVCFYVSMCTLCCVSIYYLHKDYFLTHQIHIVLINTYIWMHFSSRKQDGSNNNNNNNNNKNRMKTRDSKFHVVDL